MTEPNTTRLTEQEFLKRYVSAQRRILAYILALEPNQADADELMQETAAALWAKREEYDASKEFLPWAFSFARIEVLRFRQRRTRSRLAFDSDLLEVLAETSTFSSRDRDDRAIALADCFTKLPDSRRHLIKLRYMDGFTVAEIAKQLNKSIAVVYKTLSRSHDALLGCVQKKVSRTN